MTSPMSSSPKEDPLSCPLYVGDMVRVSEEGMLFSKRLKDRNTYLGRIKRIDDNTHLLDVEWVLGGKLLGVRRQDLVKRTAVAEGYTEHRKRRRPSLVLEPEPASKKRASPSSLSGGGKSLSLAAATDSTTAKAVTKSTSDRVPKLPSKKVSNSSKTARSNVETGIIKSNKVGSNKKASSTTLLSSSSNRKTAPTTINKRKKSTISETDHEQQQPVLPPMSPAPPHDLYERHQREFERIFNRLVKVDKFGFFLDPAPPHYDECYDESVQSSQFLQSTTTDSTRLTPISSSLSRDAIGDESKLPGGFNTAALTVNTAMDINDTSTIIEALDQSLPPPTKPATKLKWKKQALPSKPIFPAHAPYNWSMIQRRMEHGRYVLNREVDRPKRVGMKRRIAPLLYKQGVHWERFVEDVNAMCDLAIELDHGHDEECSNETTVPLSPSRFEKGSLLYAVKQVKEAVKTAYERTGCRQMNDLSNADDSHKFYTAAKAQPNTEAAMQTWRQVPFPERRYVRLRSDVVCAGLSEVDEQVAAYELRTNLPDSFVGMSYRYDDTGQSEAWMKSVVDEAGVGADKTTKPLSNRKPIVMREAALALAADDGVIRAQVNASMQSLMIAVQDRVMTESNVLHQTELKSANWITNDTSFKQRDTHPELIEKPVWGIDCYTRRNIILCLEADFEAPIPLHFVEKWLLPAINACPDSLANDIANATRLLEGLPLESTDKESHSQSTDEPTGEQHYLLRNALLKRIKTSSPRWLKTTANQIRRAREALGPDFFRIHPKGHGSILLSPVLANSLITFYRGEVYPSWRWGEKMDAIDITQQRKDLKPALPDFYNMALERPQADPRGYGLLFVDASRKAGHGSSLSHSCDPTCEVRVAALKGELCLAMTTLRELEIGDELTFDYNAVTESVNEYKSGVCLCGYGKCRGSFLHFAAADCYQQVLNRNAPIASRFASLVKGSMKMVISEEDDRVLRSHGFLTASFGAISVNRRQEVYSSRLDCDSLDFVPVWLRTFVADTLRYIEYERRALPISIICDHLSTLDKNSDSSSPTSRCRPCREPTKPESSFFYFSRVEADFVNTLMKEQNIPESLTGIQRRQAFNKVAASHWQTLSEETKASWKQKSEQDFNRRLSAWKLEKSNAKNLPAASPKGKKPRNKKVGVGEMLLGSKLSFHDADAEGTSAMEQRIQQLTQSLSRVGRVLDRHREWSFENEMYPDFQGETSVEAIRKRVHSPILMATDDVVVGWIWNSNAGVVRSSMEAINSSRWARSILSEKVLLLRSKFSDLDSFGDPTTTNVRKQAMPSPVASKARKRLNQALREIRRIVMIELKEMGKIFKFYKNLLHREEGTDHVVDGDDGQVEADPNHNGDTSFTVFENHETEIVDMYRPPQVIAKSKHQVVTGQSFSSSEELLTVNPWLEYYDERFMLQVIADLLLFYTFTSNFFLMMPYKTLTSTPIEVYARELGNEVPRSAVDANPHNIRTNGMSSEAITSLGAKLTKPELCEPDDIVAKVSVTYNEDYVLSQLLQWYNGGIGLKPGLPDMIGCVVLPSIRECLFSELTTTNRVKAEKRTTYETKTRSRLIEWLRDPFQRGGAWPREVQEAFLPKDSARVNNNTCTNYLQFGSPILDFLVSGDDSNIQAVLSQLDADDKFALISNSSSKLLQSVDKGRPAQAVSNWVQCENPACMKWRKIPWHVDIDLLPEKFFCKDNQWDHKYSSCDAPEEDWDEDDKLVGNDGKVEGSPIKKDRNASRSPLDAENFFIGARFDVLRESNRKFTVGSVSKIDLSGKVKRIRFRFHRCKPESDEWIEFGSPRIAALHSHVPKGKSSANAQQEAVLHDKAPKEIVAPTGKQKLAGKKNIPHQTFREAQVERKRTLFESSQRFDNSTFNSDYEMSDRTTEISTKAAPESSLVSNHDDAMLHKKSLPTEVSHEPPDEGTEATGFNIPIQSLSSLGSVEATARERDALAAMLSLAMGMGLPLIKSSVDTSPTVSANGSSSSSDDQITQENTDESANPRLVVATAAVPSVVEEIIATDAILQLQQVQDN